MQPHILAGLRAAQILKRMQGNQMCFTLLIEYATTTAATVTNSVTTTTTIMATVQYILFCEIPVIYFVCLA